MFTLWTMLGVRSKSIRRRYERRKTVYIPLLHLGGPTLIFISQTKSHHRSIFFLFLHHFSPSWKIPSSLELARPHCIITSSLQNTTQVWGRATSSLEQSSISSIIKSSPSGFLLEICCLVRHQTIPMRIKKVRSKAVV